MNNVNKAQIADFVNAKRHDFDKARDDNESRKDPQDNVSANSHLTVLKSIDQRLTRVLALIRQDTYTFPQKAKSHGISSRVSNGIINKLNNYTIGQVHFNEKISQTLQMINEKTIEVVKQLAFSQKEISELSQRIARLEEKLRGKTIK